MPKKVEDCVEEVKKQEGKSEEDAWAICQAKHGKESALKIAFNCGFQKESQGARQIDEILDLIGRGKIDDIAEFVRSRRLSRNADIVDLDATENIQNLIREVSTGRQLG